MVQILHPPPEYSASKAPPPCPAPFNLAQYVLSQGRKTPDKPALRIARAQGADLVTFAQLDARISALGAGLLRYGLAPGDRVMLRIGDDLMFPMAFLAAIAVGLIPVPTSAQLTMRECTAVADHVGIRMVLGGTGVAVPEGYPVIGQDALTQMSAAQMSAAEASPPHFVLGDPDRPAYILLTSGTGGAPRAVVHAHRAIWARRMMWQPWYDLTQSARMMHAGAMNWSYTLGTGLMDPWAAGATAIIAPGAAADDLLQIAATQRATHFAATPGVFRRILRGPVPPLPELQRGLSAGERLPATLRDKWQELTAAPLLEAYGMTECSTFLNSRPTQPNLRVQPGRHVALLGNSEVAVSQRDPGLMLGYLTRDGQLDLPLDGEWFRTGDIAVQTGEAAADTSLQISARVDDMINAGGHRVSPLEVEEILVQAPGITDIAVTWIEVAPQVQIIAAFYVGSADPQSLKAFAQQHLARYKQPREYIRQQALPRGANGKLSRRACRHLYEADHGET